MGLSGRGIVCCVVVLPSCPPLFSRSAEVARRAPAPFPLRGSGCSPPRGSAPAPLACKGAAPAAGAGGLPGGPGSSPGRRMRSPAAATRPHLWSCGGSGTLHSPVGGKRRKNAHLSFRSPHPPDRWGSAGRADGARWAAKVAREWRGVLSGDARPPAPPVKSGAKPVPGEAGSIWALMVK